MPIPDFQSVILPVLRLSAEGEIKLSNAVKRISDEFELTEEERNELTSGRRQSKILNRVSWSVTYLVAAGLVTRPRYGHFVITERGKSILNDPPQRIDKAYLSQFKEFNEYMSTDNKDDSSLENGNEDQSQATPEDRMGAAFEEFSANLQNELLEQIQEISPKAFERLIIDVMKNMGYGAKGLAVWTGKVGDGGIDGIIKEDALGLDVVYLQAKRYKNSVGVNEIREFIGALDVKGASATKGVLITTGSFPKSARDVAEQSQKSIILIDGKELTRLMVLYGVAVRVDSTFVISRVDKDYLDQLEFLDINNQIEIRSTFNVST